MPYPFVAAEVLTAANLNAMIGAPTQNAINDVTYTAALLDAGKTVTLSNASAVTLTIPAQATVAWAANTQLNFLNIGAGTVTITPAAGVTINGTPLTLATSKGGSLVRTDPNVWTFIPFSSGEGAANFTNTATGTYTTGGISYKYITFTGSGDLIVDQAGFADVLVIGGGGGGGNSYGGGGAGGHLVINNAYFSAATHTVTVGAGGAGAVAVSPAGKAGANGLSSFVGSYFAVGGGAGAGNSSGAGTIRTGFSGGSGGGAGDTGGTGGAGVSGQGNNGGNTSFGLGAGGGGAGAVGGNGASGAGGSGGAGLANSLTNASVTRAGGGGGGGSTAGAGGTGGGGAGTTNNTTGGAGGVNTGGGGGGGGYAGEPGGSGGAGGSGLVIVRVVV